MDYREKLYTGQKIQLGIWRGTIVGVGVGGITVKWQTVLDDIYPGSMQSQLLKWEDLDTLNPTIILSGIDRVLDEI